MATPVVQSSATSNDTDRSGTTFSMNYPTGIQNKDVLIAFVSNWSAATYTNGIVFPSDWIQIYSDIYSSVCAYACYAYYADGTETGTFNVTVENEQAAGIVYRISGAANPNTEPPYKCNSVGASSGGSIVPGGSQFSAFSLNDYELITGPFGRYDQYLGMVSYHHIYAMNGVLTYPDNYSNFTSIDSSAAGNIIGVAAGHRDIQSIGEFYGRWRMYDKAYQQRVNLGILVPPAVRYVPPSTFPYINKCAFSTDAQRYASTKFDLILPPTEPGDVIIAVVAVHNAISDTVTWPSDWNELYDQVASGGGNNMMSSAAWKKADGGDSRTITLTIDANPAVGVAFTVANVPDPEPTLANCFEWAQNGGGFAQVHGAGSITAAGGSDNYLWVAVYATEDDYGSYDAFATDYDGRFACKGNWATDSQDVTICVAHSNDETARTALNTNYLSGGGALADVCAQFVFYPGSFTTEPNQFWYLNWRGKGRNGMM